MTESRLQRWSRKKIETKREPELSPPPAAEPEVSPEEQDLAINETLPEHEVLEKYNLPNPDAIELGTDIRGFMRKEIPELLRRRALRSLWKSNPVLAVLDGLNDYDEDFTDAASAGNAVKTLYKVGQGFDRTPKTEETADEQIDGRAREQVETLNVRPPEEESRDLAGEIADESQQNIAPTFLTTAGYDQPAVAEEETNTAPRYRPRMRFND